MTSYSGQLEFEYNELRARGRVRSMAFWARRSSNSMNAMAADMGVDVDVNDDDNVVDAEEEEGKDG